MRSRSLYRASVSHRLGVGSVFGGSVTPARPRRPAIVRRFDSRRAQASEKAGLGFADRARLASRGKPRAEGD